MPYKPRTAEQRGETGVINASKLRGLLRQTTLSARKNPSDAALFQFLDTLTEWADRTTTNINNKISIDEGVNLLTQTTGILPPSSGGGLSGTYTPTLTNALNVTGSTAVPCFYSRIGDVVHVSGSFYVEPTASGVQTQLEISLPIISAFASAGYLAGVAQALSIGMESAAIIADSDRAQVDWIAGFAGSSELFYFTFGYLIQ